LLQSSDSVKKYILTNIDLIFKFKTLHHYWFDVTVVMWWWWLRYRWWWWW